MFLALGFTGDRLLLHQPSPNTLRFAHTYTTESERAILRAAIAEFEQAHPGVRIEQIVSNSETYNTIGWRLQFRGRQQPDLYFHWQGFKVDYCIDQGWAMDLTPHLSPGFAQEFVPAATRQPRSGIYLLPQSIDLSNLVWYNRDLFARLNLSEPVSLEEWLDVCKKLRAANLLPLGQGNRDLWPMGNFSAELLGQALGAEGTARLFQRGAVINPTAILGLGALDEFSRAGALDLPGVLDRGAIGSLGDIDAKVLFLTAKAAQHVVGSWFLADVEDARSKSELKFEVGLFPIPAARDQTNAITAVTTGFLVNPKTRNPQAAVAFLELLLSRKYQSEFAMLGNLSARRDARAFTAHPLARRMLEILATTPVIVPPPDTGYAPEQAAVFYELCGKLLTGQLALKDAAGSWAREKEALARKGL